MNRLLAIGCCLWALVACRCDVSTRALYGEGQFLPTDSLTVMGEEARLDFGAVAFGETRELTVTIYNGGSGRLGVGSIDGPAIPFSVPAQLPFPDVTAGESHQIFVRFAPPTQDEELLTVPYETEVRFHLSGTDGPKSLRLKLFGRGTLKEDCVVVSPSPVDFGPVPLGCAAARTATLTNGCAAPLRVSEIAVSGSGFTLGTSMPSGGETVPPGGQLPLSMRFNAGDVIGESSGLARVAFLQENRSSARRASLQANAVSRATITETFVVSHALDILVLPSDGSSYDGGNVPPAYMQGIRTLFDRLPDAGVDFHLGFTHSYWDYDDCGFTCEPTYVLGELVAAADAGAPLFYTAVTPDKERLAQSSLANSTFAGLPLGQGTPICFEAARRAITPPISLGINSGFLRDGVPLAILCLSYRGERSTTIRAPAPGWFQPLPVQFYADALAAARGGRQLVSISAVGPLASEPTCAEKGTAKDQGRFAEAARLTGGVAFDVCNQDWDAIFEAFRVNWSGLPRHLGIKGTIDDRYPMDVLLDGQLQAGTEWTFEIDGGILTLAKVPPAGANVEVTYTPRCE